jgi:hypothetical protein
MLSQQDMEDFMEIDAAPGERDEDAAKLEKPSSDVQRHVPQEYRALGTPVTDD